MGIVFVDSSLKIKNIAAYNTSSIERVETISTGLFNDVSAALWKAKRKLRDLSNNLPTLTLKLKRTASRLEPGDLFSFTYSPYGFTSTLFRVISYEESTLGEDGDYILITAIKDADCNIETADFTPDDGLGYTSKQVLAETPSTAAIVEAPYITSVGKAAIFPILSAGYHKEIGYQVYMSSDNGTSYTKIADGISMAVQGRLVENYSSITNKIDKTGFCVDIKYNGDIISSVTRTQAVSGKNLALLDDELISFQTITPLTTVRYKITNVVRGRDETTVADHYEGATFSYLGSYDDLLMLSPDLLDEKSVRYFKFVPYTPYGSVSLDTVTPVTLKLERKYDQQYRPLNFTVNDSDDDTKRERRKWWYSPGDTSIDYIRFTWRERRKHEGAGIGDPTSISAEQSYYGWNESGPFEFTIYIRNTTGQTWQAARTVTVRDSTWTASAVSFTHALNRAKNLEYFGVDDYAKYVKLSVRVRDAVKNIFSDWSSVEVEKR